MIPAKITNLNPVQVRYIFEYHPEINENEYVIADVENINQGKITKRWYAEIRVFFEDDNLSYLKAEKLKLNQSCFIEPTTEGKCKIVKLN